jgi:hypothetical protein
VEGREKVELKGSGWRWMGTGWWTALAGQADEEQEHRRIVWTVRYLREPELPASHVRRRPPSDGEVGVFSNRVPSQWKRLDDQLCSVGRTSELTAWQEPRVWSACPNRGEKPCPQ